MYIHYKNTREHAWHYLIRHKIKSLPVDVFSLCQKDKHLLFPYSSEKAKEIIETLEIEELLTTTDGFTMRIAEHTMIFWNDALSPQRQRFTVAHELGHIVNGDIGATPTYRNREPSDHDDYRDTAANIFASRLLSPACVLWALQVRDTDTIADLCGLSETAAKWRCKRLLELYEREKRWLVLHKKSCFLLSPSEQQVFKQFRRYIHKQKRLLSSRNKQSPLL